MLALTVRSQPVLVHTTYMLLKMNKKMVCSFLCLCGNRCTALQLVVAIPVMKCFGEESFVCIISLLNMG